MNNFFSKKKGSPIYRIGVDFDLTLVDSLHPWIDWFNKLTEEKVELVNRDLIFWGEPIIKFKPITKACYTDFKGDLAILMRDRQSYLPLGYQFDPMSWWRQQDLYCEMQPLVGALTWMMLVRETLVNHHDFSAVEFVCVSKCEPEHERSKRRFLPTHFPDVFNGFVSTDDKHLVAVDCLIDDNPKYVIPCRDNGIFQIYVPQGNYELFPDGADFVDEMLFVKPDHGMTNHFEYLIANNSDICDMLHRHYNYVR